MGRHGTGPVIGVDAMGGDLAPRVVIQGALEALRESGAMFDVALIGDESAIVEEADRLGVRNRLPRIIHASEQVEMAESAASSVRKKRDSSISVSARLQKDHETDALVSAGNTGAVVAAALFEMGRIESIQRPAIATVLPTPQGNVVVLDVGATSDPKPSHLYQFASWAASTRGSCSTWSGRGSAFSTSVRRRRRGASSTTRRISS